MRIPSRACTTASSRVMARTAPFEAVSALDRAKNLVCDPRNSARVGRTSELRRCGTEDGDERGCVDDRALAASRILAHRLDGVLAAPPDALQVAAEAGTVSFSRPLAARHASAGSSSHCVRKGQSACSLRAQMSGRTVHRQVPDALLRVERVVVLRVHDTGIVATMSSAMIEQQADRWDGR